MNESTTQPQTMQQPKQKAPTPGERTPIRIEKLIVNQANPNGIRIPDGPEGKSDKMQHTIIGGEQGDIRTEIEYRPWMRAFRVARTKKVTRTGANGKDDIVTWVAMGKPFFIPDALAVFVPADEL